MSLCQFMIIKKMLKYFKTSFTKLIVYNSNHWSVFCTQLFLQDCFVAVDIYSIYSPAQWYHLLPVVKCSPTPLIWLKLNQPENPELKVIPEGRISAEDKKLYLPDCFIVMSCVFNFTSTHCTWLAGFKKKFAWNFSPAAPEVWIYFPVK